MEKIISIVGLTSSGKSDLAIFLAQKLGGEIISCDSRQVYIGLDWCSGKVTKEEQSMAVHHLLDVASLGQQFSLYDFQKQAYSAIEDILSRGKVPILCGGTGLYVRSVVQGFNLCEVQADTKKRSDLEEKTLEELEALVKQQNLQVPPEPTKRRLVRLLEKQGENQKPNEPKYKVLQIGISFEREEIYSRIEQRLSRRMPFMIEEIKNLLSQGESSEFLKSLGLEAKMVTEYIEGKFSSYEEFFEELFKQERHFAKRQKTWYNKEPYTIWIDGKKQVQAEALKIAQKFLENNEK